MLVFPPSVAEMLEAASSRRWLSFEELNSCIPDEWVDPGLLHVFLARVDALGIELIDLSEAGGLS